MGSQSREQMDKSTGKRRGAGSALRLPGCLDLVSPPTQALFRLNYSAWHPKSHERICSAHLSAEPSCPRHSCSGEAPVATDFWCVFPGACLLIRIWELGTFWNGRGVADFLLYSPFSLKTWPSSCPCLPSPPLSSAACQALLPSLPHTPLCLFLGLWDPVSLCLIFFFLPSHPLH